MLFYCYRVLYKDLQYYCLCHATTESYGQHLEAALFEGDVDYAKVIVKKLVEAKRNQRNFSVAFLPVGGRSFSSKYVCENVTCYDK